MDCNIAGLYYLIYYTKCYLCFLAQSLYDKIGLVMVYVSFTQTIPFVLGSSDPLSTGPNLPTYNMENNRE